jgi:hypothetical protein
MADEPVTKQDLRGLEARLDGKLDAIRGEMADMESRLRTAVEESETRILTAVYGYTETIGARLDASTRRFTGVEERLEIVERRVLDIEKRLNLPPAA